MHRIINAVRGNLVAWLALFVALGGTSLAASHYIITSTRQIKPSVVKALRGKTGAQGSQGPQGAQGLGGPQGPAGPNNLSPITLIEGPKNTIPAESHEGSLVLCPSGQHAVSGGGTQITGKPGLVSDRPSEEGSAASIGWFVIGINPGTLSGTIQSFVYCAGAGRAVAASTRTAERKRAIRVFDQTLARLG